MSKITYKNIINTAKKSQENVKKEKKNGISNNWGYYFSKSILNLEKDITRITINKASNPRGNSITKTISKSVYLDACKRYVKFVETHHQLPNYVTVDGYKVSPRLFTEVTARILVYYDKNKKLPSTAKFDSNVFKTVTIKKYGHATKHCCDNMGQNTGYYCACHSLQEVFRNLTGIVVPQSTIAGWAGTTTSGTGHAGMEQAVMSFNKKYGYNLKVTWKNMSDIGWTGVKKIVESKNQDCIIHNLYRNQYGHYEVINSISGSTIYVQNSLGSMCTASCYSGYVENRTQKEFNSYISGISQKSVMVITNDG